MKKNKIAAFALAIFLGANVPAYALPVEDTAAVGKVTAPADSGFDYLLLVNKANKLPDDYEARVDLVTVKNVFGKEFQVERETYKHFMDLREDLQKDGIQIELESAYRSVARQKELTEELRVTEGEDYVKYYVAVPGYSEHHTGMALDVAVVENGKTTDDVYGEAETSYQKMHRRLAAHGFILRYPPGKAAVTGYAYESWHCRYVGQDTAQKIYRQNLTLEEYLSDKAAMSGQGPRASAEYWLNRPNTDRRHAALIREAFGRLGQICDNNEFAGENGSMQFIAELGKRVGVKLPTKPEKLKNTKATIALSGLNRSEKLACLQNVALGSLLFTNDHAMIYLGTDEAGTPYVIHASDTRWFPMEGDGSEGENTAPLKYYTRRVVAEDLFFFDTPTEQAIDSLVSIGLWQ